MIASLRVEAKPQMNDPLANDDRFNRLVAKLALPRSFVFGLVQMMVMRCFLADTDLLGSNEFEVERAAEWPGRPAVFFKAIKDEWLVELAGKYYLRAKGQWAVIEIAQMPKARRDIEAEVEQLLIEFGVEVSEHGTSTIQDIYRRYGASITREALLSGIAEVGRTPKIVSHAQAFVADQQQKKAAKAERARRLFTKKK